MRVQGGCVVNQRSIQALFGIIIIEKAFKKGIEAEDGLITLAKKCCLNLNEVKIWVSDLQKKKENCAKGVQKAEETIARMKSLTETIIFYTHIFFK